MKQQRKNKRFSFSLLNCDCPRRIHKAVSRDRVEVFPADETDEGRRIHVLLAEILSSKERDFSRLTNYATIYGEPERVFSKVKGRYSTETKIRLFIGDKKFTTVSDLLVTRRGERDIIDHKTSFSQEVLPSYREQLQYYALPFLRKGLRVKVGVHFVRYARLEWTDILEGLDDYARIATKLSERIEKVERILEGKPEPKPSNFECAYCGFILSCPLRPTYSISNEEDAVKLAGDYLRAKAKAKKMEQLLRNWANQQGNLRFNGSEVGFHPSTKTVIDEQATIAFLQKNDIPLGEVFSANASKFKRLAKQIDELSSFAEIESHSRWGVKTVE
jgi:CRISPR/Cas system-associated exonuclease Cas4 (RecB family)